MNTHTEGIWKAAEKAVPIQDFFACQVFTLGDAEKCPATAFSVTEEQAVSNATLIAAAPELLDAVIAFIEATKAKETSLLTDAYIKAVTALEKATE